MNPQEEVEHMKQQNLALVAKGTLLLTVSVETEEQADEIMRWMYSDRKPMKATLTEIAWDKVAIPTKQADALEVLLRAAATQPLN